MRDDPVRDATYEEIMHYVDRFGLRAAHPTFTRDLNDAHDNARAKGLYNRNTTGEYWICGFEAYFDFWRHDPTGTGSRGEEYIPWITLSCKHSTQRCTILWKAFWVRIGCLPPILRKNLMVRFR